MYSNWEWIATLPPTVRLILTIIALTFLLFIIVVSIIDGIKEKN